MSIEYADFDLESYLNNLGDAVIAIGDTAIVDGLGELGAKEGDVTVAFNTEYNNLTFGEQTGPAVHEATVQGENPSITIPIIVSNPLLWERISPLGIKGGGFSRPQPVQETSLVIIPDKELLAASAPFAHPAPAGPWADPPGAPINWFWAWRVYLQRGDLVYRNPDGRKSINQLIVQVMYDATRPEGMKLYTIGDPVANGLPVADLVI